MAAWQPELVKKIYPRFRRKLKPAGKNLRLGALAPNEQWEISTEGLNTAFAFLLAREMGDQETAQRLLNFADENLDLVREARGWYYQKKPGAYLTALFTLGLTLPSKGGGLAGLLAWRPNPREPYLARLSNPNVYVNQAEMISGEELVIGLAGNRGEEVELIIRQISKPFRISLNEQEFPLEDSRMFYEEGSNSFKIRFELFSPETRVRISGV